MEPVYAHFLGSFALMHNGVSQPLGRSKVVVELCCYLLAHVGQYVARDELLELLWPEVDPCKAVHRLHVAVSGLRTLLGSAASAGAVVVHLDNDRYVVPAEAVQTDFAEFDRLYDCGAAAIPRGHPDCAAGALRQHSRTERTSAPAPVLPRRRGRDVVSAGVQGVAVIVDIHCHAGKGDGFRGPWDTEARIEAHLERARARRDPQDGRVPGVQL